MAQKNILAHFTQHRTMHTAGNFQGSAPTIVTCYCNMVLKQKKRVRLVFWIDNIMNYSWQHVVIGEWPSPLRMAVQSTLMASSKGATPNAELLILNIIFPLQPMLWHTCRFFCLCTFCWYFNNISTASTFSSLMACKRASRTSTLKDNSTSIISIFSYSIAISNADLPRGSLQFMLKVGSS